MPYPAIDRAMRLRIVKKRNETIIYGNSSAFRTLARWMKWLAASNPREHYEMHVPWHLQSPFSRSQRVDVVTSTSGGSKAPKGYEITFMVVEGNELKQGSTRQKPVPRKRGRKRPLQRSS
jgi:hypothetical protein